MKICQDISQEMAKVQNVIDQFKELAEKVAKAGSKEEINKLQSEFAGLKAENLDECIKQQQKLTALSMNFPRVLEKKLKIKEGELDESVEFDRGSYLIKSNGAVEFDENRYLIKLDVPWNSDIFEVDLSKIKITELNLRHNKATKILKSKFLPKNLQILYVGNSQVDLSEVNLSETNITELNFCENNRTKIKKKFLPKNLQILKVNFSQIDLSETNLSETEITELNFSWNKGTKVLKTEYLPKNLKELDISNSLILEENPNIVQELQTFFKKRGQEVEIIYK